MFQHTATRRWLLLEPASRDRSSLFQHTATRRWLRDRLDRLKADAIVSTHSHPKVAAPTLRLRVERRAFQHTATRRWLRDRLDRLKADAIVSTHSHPKVAAPTTFAHIAAACGFNTQPPEGGCAAAGIFPPACLCFNTQPPEGGCSLPQKPCSIRFRSPDFAKLPRKA